MSTYIRAGSLSAYREIAQACGLDAHRALALAGINAHSLENPDTLILYQSVIQLLEYSANMSGCLDFGLRMAEHRKIEDFGVFAVLLKHSSTLGEALEHANHYLFVHHNAARYVPKPVPYNKELIDVHFEIQIPHLTHYSQAVEMALGSFMQSMRMLSGDKSLAKRVTLPHTRLSPYARYVELFGTKVEFQQATASIRFAREDLQRPLPGADTQIAQLAKYYLEHNFTKPEEALSQRVTQLAIAHLQENTLSLSQIAHALAMHPRTLHRQLAKEGQCFEDIVDTIRSDQLVTLLAVTPLLSISQITYRLGYSDPASLSRSCRRWYGCTPKELRVRHTSFQDTPLKAAND